MLRGRSARKTANRDSSSSVHNVIQLHASTPLVCDVRRILWFPAFRVRLFLRSYGPRLTGLIYANSFSFLESRLPAARTPSEKRRENRPFRTLAGGRRNNYLSARRDDGTVRRFAADAFDGKHT